MPDVALQDLPPPPTVAQAGTGAAPGPDVALADLPPPPGPAPGLLRQTGQALAAPFETAASMATGALAPAAAAAENLITGKTSAEDYSKAKKSWTYTPDNPIAKEDIAALSYLPEHTVGKVTGWLGDVLSKHSGGMFSKEEAEDTINTALAGLGGEGLVGRAASAGKAGEVAGEAGATARAAQYAKSHGIDWDRAGAAFKKNLADVAKDATALERLDPEAVKHQALLQGLPVPVSIDVQANKDLEANLEALRGRAAGLRGGVSEPGAGRRAPVAASEQIGKRIQGPIERPTTGTTDRGLRAKERQSRSNYQQLFKAAEKKAEPNARLPGQPLEELLGGRPDIQHLGFVNAWMRKEGIESVAEDGSVSIKDVSARELQDLRSEASSIARAGGTDGFYAGKVVKAIDDTMEQVPEAAKAWKAAQQAFRQHKLTFEDQAAVEKLTGMKSRTDPNVALEKTVDAIRGSSIEGIRQIKRTLTDGGTVRARMAGREALRDIRAGVLDDILNRATKVVTTDKSGTTRLTAAKLKSTIDSYGRDKLNELIGKGNTDQLYKILEGVKITATDPTVRSSTLQNFLSFLERFKVPGVSVVIGMRESAKKFGERGRAVAATQKARPTPLEEAAAQVAKSRRRRYRAAPIGTAISATGAAAPIGATTPEGGP